MKDLFISCPFHEGDKTPSLSVLLRDKNGLKAGFCKCFGCGWSGNYKQVEQALGHSLPIEPTIRATMEKNRSMPTNSRTRLRTAVVSGTAEKKYRKADLPFKFSQYLKDRGIGEVIQRFNKVYQDKDGKLHMPIFDPQGIMMGSVERATGSTKFYGVTGNILYPSGIEEISPLDFVYVTEGQIDKMTLEEAGFKAVALIGATNFRLLRHLKNVNICLALDNDEAGRLATRHAQDYLETLGRHPNLYTLDLPDGVKDVNELLMQIKNAGKSVEELSIQVKAHTRRLGI